MRRAFRATAAMQRLRARGTTAAAAAGCERAPCGWRALLLPQQNRQSLYMYGSEVAVEKECIRQLQSGVFVIHPFSLMRSYYIMGMMAITFLNLIGIPMEIAFLDGTSGLAWEGFNVFSDTLFLIDVALNFRMGIISENGEEAILDIKRIRVCYLRTWFIPDVIAAFPIGYILLFADLHYHSDDNPSKTTRMMRILMFVRILSLIRLARVSRLVRFFNEVEKVSNANLEVVRLFFRILSLFMMIFLLCHWNGCIQYFVPMLEEFPTDCWVRKENLMNATVIVKYSWGVFRALSQMIALSYGSMDAPTSACILRGDVDRDGEHGVRVPDVHGAGGQRHRHDRQHRPRRQGVQEQDEPLGALHGLHETPARAAIAHHQLLPGTLRREMVRREGGHAHRVVCLEGANPDSDVQPPAQEHAVVPEQRRECAH
ncbi:hyperpolarization activated cyclic nucleotide-gated potassium channel 5 isoform X2 [Syngnathus scovelli]|uniref:hyperpolarization activated cyclic nucleotide-gated potassium channel 5 isoform X2 n=1 Tax=Syngnathus scovelli TaxID=161590 RepID=UPI00210F23C9|nr:potassium/sodium hyperpolarization-activated cyclic nucleotide-gated channel 2 isoform X2 [Syngnathus scovelli]